MANGPRNAPNLHYQGEGCSVVRPCSHQRLGLYFIAITSNSASHQPLIGLPRYRNLELVQPASWLSALVSVNSILLHIAVAKDQQLDGGGATFDFGHPAFTAADEADLVEVMLDGVRQAMILASSYGGSLWLKDSHSIYCSPGSDA
jgi:hypothetical protein